MFNVDYMFTIRFNKRNKDILSKIVYNSFRTFTLQSECSYSMILYQGWMLKGTKKMSFIKSIHLDFLHFLSWEFIVSKLPLSWEIDSWTNISWLEFLSFLVNILWGWVFINFTAFDDWIEPFTRNGTQKLRTLHKVYFLFDRSLT